MSLSHYAISIRGSNFLFVFQPSLFSFKEGIPSLLDDTLTSLLQLPAKRRTHKISLQLKDVYHIWFSVSFSEHPHMLAPSWKYNQKNTQMKDWATDQISAINNSWFVAWLNGSPPRVLCVHGTIERLQEEYWCRHKVTRLHRYCTPPRDLNVCMQPIIGLHANRQFLPAGMC